MRALATFLVFACLLAGLPARAEISSYAIVRPDGVLSVGGRPVRLYGIMIPPSERQCRTFERPVECGSRSALQLGFKIGSNFVHCQEMRQDPDGTIVGLCRLEGEDLSAWMLLQGWALAGPDAPYEYRQYERLAQAQSRGVWGFPVDSIQRRSQRQVPLSTPASLPILHPSPARTRG
ncbi:MAG: thermonuclease family protein [Proteobacteria bacterium]|nr:thermonuclease family protein [Pseudomonadota bacterium]MBI3498481.1 thermonuclease family protein [Pseudomonadota bacterium]